ncbi:hypothetical protein SNEBB_005829 [Seison nebaliae]|nr:hypothetical protein SNEBB_005829 [Seison nebaliae]
MDFEDEEERPYNVPPNINQYFDEDFQHNIPHNEDYYQPPRRFNNRPRRFNNPPIEPDDESYEPPVPVVWPRSPAESIMDHEDDPQLLGELNVQGDEWDMMQPYEEPDRDEYLSSPPPPPFSDDEDDDDYPHVVPRRYMPLDEEDDIPPFKKHKEQ